MAEENSSTMNLDLNLGPLDDSSDGDELGTGSYPNVAVNLDDWLDGPVPRLREVVRHRSQRWRSLGSQLPISPETQNLALGLIGGEEDSVANGEQHAQMPKVCENGCGYAEHETMTKQDDDGKNLNEECSLFDCNVCLDLAKDPVVTCCGHLFCWPCLYQWLYCHSDADECPVCKGAVTIMNVTPIYGRGNTKQEPNVDCSLQIPHRPQARRVESWRQTIERTELTTPMAEMIRHLGSPYDLSQGLAQLQSQSRNTPPELPRRSSTFNRLHTYRGMHRERSPAVFPDDLVNLTERSAPSHLMRGYRWLSSMLLHRTNSLGTATLSSLASALNTDENPAAERLVQSYFQINPVAERREEVPLPPSLEDRESLLSSIAAVIQSGDQALDNNVFEIESSMAVQDNEDSRMRRRRRLN